LKPFPPPHFYHIAEASNMTSIRRHGLLSTERLGLCSPAASLVVGHALVVDGGYTVH
jgi:hypothetical protein